MLPIAYFIIMVSSKRKKDVGGSSKTCGDVAALSDPTRVSRLLVLANVSKKKTRIG